MAPTDTEVVLHWDKLPAEVRLLIYEEAMRFEHPIKKRPIKHASKSAVLHPVKSKFALLYVNKQIMHEALPVLYQCNTISMTHMGLHSLSSPARQLDIEHIKHLKIRFDPRPGDTWMWCSHCCHIDNLVERVNTERFPNLQTVFVQFNKHWIRVDTARTKLRKDLDFEFMTPDRFKIIGLREDLQVNFEHESFC